MEAEKPDEMPYTVWTIRIAAITALPDVARALLEYGREVAVTHGYEELVKEFDDALSEQ